MREVSRIRSGVGLKSVAYVVTIIFIVLMLFPLVLILGYSMKDATAMYDVPPNVLPAPARSVSIVIDYTHFEGEQSDVLQDRMLRDAAIAMYVVYGELNRSSLGEIKVYGTIRGRTVFYQRAHTMNLRLQLDYTGGVYQAVYTWNRSTLTFGGKYRKFAEKIGYSYSPAGLPGSASPAHLGVNDLDAAIASLLRDEARDRVLDGELQGTEVRSRWVLLLENYLYYAIVPVYMFSMVSLIAQYSFLAFIFNTALVMVWAVISQVGLCSLTAFALSRLFKKRMSNILMFYFLVTLMVPFMCILVPQLILIRNLGMINTYGAMLVPYLYPAAFYTFLFRGFFDRLPQSLFDAASMDGASPWHRYTRICMPLSTPILSVVMLNVIVSAWGDFFWYWLAANRPNLWTMNLALFSISQLPTTKENISMGLSFLSIAPVIIVALIFSRQIKESIAKAGIKG